MTRALMWVGAFATFTGTVLVIIGLLNSSPLHQAGGWTLYFIGSFGMLVSSTAWWIRHWRDVLRYWRKRL